MAIYEKPGFPSLGFPNHKGLLDEIRKADGGSMMEGLSARTSLSKCQTIRPFPSLFSGPSLSRREMQFWRIVLVKFWPCLSPTPSRQTLTSL